MPSPIANFGYSKDGLVINFTNLSLNTVEDSTYLWDFGDGNNSTSENPSHTFAEEGFFTVKLIITNPGIPDPEISELEVMINLTSNITPTLFFNIPAMVDLYSPTGVIGTISNHSQKEFLIAKWQLYLQPLIYIPEPVLVENTHNVFAWPALVNTLIARLVVIDILQMEATKFLMDTSLGGQINGEGTSQTNASGSIKSIETGPTKVERYENKDVSSNSEKILNISKAYGVIMSQGGIFDELKSLICQDALRVDVYLPMCGIPLNRVRPMKVAKSCKSGYKSNPFGVTKRMT